MNIYSGLSYSGIYIHIVLSIKTLNETIPDRGCDFLVVFNNVLFQKSSNLNIQRSRLKYVSTDIPVSFRIP